MPQALARIAGITEGVQSQLTINATSGRSQGLGRRLRVPQGIFTSGKAFFGGERVQELTILGKGSGCRDWGEGVTLRVQVPNSHILHMLTYISTILNPSR